MKKSYFLFSRELKISVFLFLFVLVIAAISCDSKPPYNSKVAQAQRGKLIFQKNCVQCHGENGKGIMIDSLQTKAADLTQIKYSRRTKEFPILEIANMIDGRKMAKSHGSRVMPVWGEVFSKNEHLDEMQIKGKMAELIAYLMTIQE